jgi:hypothetical protein
MTSNADIEMRWVEGWNEVYAIAQQQRDIPCQLPDWTVVTLDNWRLPVNFTIHRDGVLVNDGWKEKKPAWTAERLEQIVTPLLNAPA